LPDSTHAKSTSFTRGDRDFGGALPGYGAVALAEKAEELECPIEAAEGMAIGLGIDGGK
jgi:hypothetical protein